jgi:metallo-beta-lactamase family protein
MQIKFLGAAGTVTGSCYLLTSQSDQSILIDCGMFQGSADLEKLNYLPLECDCSQISGAILTHAHLDHCGRLPTLLKQGFHKPIWMTPATKDITEVSLYDSAKIATHDHPEAPLYEETDVTELMELFKTVEYGTPFSIGDFEIVMRDAGHILGSAFLEIKDQSDPSGPNKIIFSADLGNSPQELIQSTEQPDASDFVLIESTYGDTVHPAEDASEIIAAEVQAVEKNGGTLLIPAFSIERSQEILHRIVHLKQSGQIKEETPVFFDSPMAEKVTQIFEKYPQLYNQELKQDSIQGSPFHFPGLTVVGGREEKEMLSRVEGAKVIVAGSGMMTGGRIVSHAQRYLPLKTTRILFVGYQGEGTLGRAILEGQKTVKIKGEPILVQATVSQTRALSSHADQPRLIKWLGGIRGIQKIFIVHGEDEPRRVLAEKIKSDLKISDVVLPTLNETFEIT